MSKYPSRRRCAFPRQVRAAVFPLAEVLERRTFLTAAAAGAEFRVNETTALDQRRPAIAADGDGNFVVAWTSISQDPDGSSGIYARRYNAAGAALGHEFRVNTFTAGDQSFPAVASDADGDFVVAWVSNLLDGNGGGVYAQRYDAAGNPQGDEFRVTVKGKLPTVVADADGDFVIAWERSIADGISGYNVYAQRYNAAGAALGGEFLVNTTTIGHQLYPAVASDATGNFVVTWSGFGQEPNINGIYARRYNAAGAALGGEFLVNTTLTGGKGLPTVAMDADGDFVVAWESVGQDGSSSGVYAQRYNAAGTAQGTEFRVNTTTANAQRVPRAAMDAAGDFVIAWQSDRQDGNGVGVYAQQFNAAGVAQGAETRVNTFTTYDQAYPAVAADASGDFVVAWESNGQDPDNSYGIYAQRFVINSPPTTVGLPPFNTVQNTSPSPSINLLPFFSDVLTPASGLSLAVVANSNPALFGSTPVSGGILTLNLASNAAGTATLTVRATDAGGLFVDTPFQVTVRPSWLAVPSGGVWSISGTSTSSALTLTSGDFNIPSDPSILNLNINITAPATLKVTADAHLGTLTLNGAGANVTFTDPAGSPALQFSGGAVPVEIPFPNPTLTPVPRDPPNLSVGDVTKAEGNAGVTTFSFPVTLDRAGDAPVRVYYATANVTAARGSDYLAVGGVLTFRPGETSKVVTVLVRGDTRFEADERFRVVLYGATGAVVADGAAVGTIRNDDAPPAPRFLVGNAAVAEGDAGTRAVAFDVTLDRAATAAVTVKYATADGTAKAGSDYLAASGVLTFRPGETRNRVTVYVKGDKSREADETFFLDLSGPAGVARGRGVIRNDD